MRKIMICTANQAERGLLEPVFKRIKENPELKLIKVNFSQIAVNFAGVYKRAVHLINVKKPDIVLVPCDRKEMLAVAIAAFYSNVFLAHFEAGEIDTGSPDDMARMIISRLSHIMFCNTERAKNNLIKLGEEPQRVFNVGFTCADDIAPTEYDELKKKYFLSGTFDFDLLLLHPNSYSKEETIKDIETANAFVKSQAGFEAFPGQPLAGFTVILYPNNDLYCEEIINWIKTIENEPNVKVLTRVPRNDFLGLLNNCKNYIGNSSAACYEAELFGTNCIQIGERNGNRDRLKPEPGGSDKIVEILSSIKLDEEFLKKKVVINVG